MCGRFSILNDKKCLAEHFHLNDACEFINSYNVTPAKQIPAIRLKDDNRELCNFYWGLIPHWAKDSKFKPINAKAETVAEKPYFRSAYKHRRCLIPASGFYEWQGQRGHKQPYYFKLKNTDLFAFAGLWEYWEGPEGTIDSCTIITTDANSVMKPVHDRMPVILDPDAYDEWLHEGDKDLLIPYSGDMICHAVSKKINNPDNNGKDLIQPVAI